MLAPGQNLKIYDGQSAVGKPLAYTSRSRLDAPATATVVMTTGNKALLVFTSSRIVEGGVFKLYHQKGEKILLSYACAQITQHYCLLTGGGVKIKSGPLCFRGPAQYYLYCYSDNCEAISVIIFIISYSNNELSSYRLFPKL